MRVTDWMQIGVGDRVYQHDNPRHVGRVEAIGQSIKVRWYDNRILSYYPVESAREKLLIVIKPGRKLACGCCTNGCVCIEHGRVKEEELCLYHSYD